MSKPSTIKPIIGARASPLAQTQSMIVATALGVEASHIGYTTKGDRITDTHFRDIGGKELFVSDIEQALLDKKIDLAVHSLKDMPAIQPDGIKIVAILPREDARDALVSNSGIVDLNQLPRNAKIGTASPRRTAQIKAFRRDLEPILLRGNVETRLKKIAAGEMTAAILAMAGLKRLGRLQMATPIPQDQMLSAAAQGAICVECRTADTAMLDLCASIHDEETAQCVLAERSFTASFGASCHAPVAAFAERQGTAIFLRAQLLTPDGAQSFMTEQKGDDAVRLGVAAAQNIGDQAGKDILQQLGANIDL